MRYSSYINNTKTSEWGLNLSQAYLFSLLADVGQWATETIIDGKVYYWVSRNKIINELPALTDKPDTVYRLLKQLSDAGLIDYTKQGVKDLVKLTNKGKEWNIAETRKNIRGSENNPNELGKISESSSEKNPTYNTTSNNNTTSIIDTDLFEIPEYLNTDDFKRGLGMWVQANIEKNDRPLATLEIQSAIKAIAKYAKGDIKKAYQMIKANHEAVYRKMYEPKDSPQDAPVKLTKRKYI